MTAITAAEAGQGEGQILRGVVLMLAFCLLAPFIDVASKLAAEGGMPVGQITLARFVVQGLLMLPFVLIAGLRPRMTRRTLGAVFLRAFLLLISTFSFVSGIRVMPLADALAIAFVEPFLLLLLGWAMFGDRVGPRRILACLVGFGGALLVIQPSLTAFGLVALWPLLTAFSFALYMLVTRALAARMASVAMQFHTSWTGVALALPLFWLIPGEVVPDMRLLMPEGLQWLWLFGVGFWACLAHMCMTRALSHAPSATLAPLHYLEIVAAVILGWAIFGDLPNRMSFAGILVIVLSGLYIIHRERLARRTALIPDTAP